MTNTTNNTIAKLKEKESEFWSIVKQKDCSRSQRAACLKVIAVIQKKINSIK